MFLVCKIALSHYNSVFKFILIAKIQIVLFLVFKRLVLLMILIMVKSTYCVANYLKLIKGYNSCITLSSFEMRSIYSWWSTVDKRVLSIRFSFKFAKGFIASWDYLDNFRCTVIRIRRFRVQVKSLEAVVMIKGISLQRQSPVFRIIQLILGFFNHCFWVLSAFNLLIL